jgi:hypothetical protein
VLLKKAPEAFGAVPEIIIGRVYILALIDLGAPLFPESIEFVFRHRVESLVKSLSNDSRYLIQSLSIANSPQLFFDVRIGNNRMTSVDGSSCRRLRLSIRKLTVPHDRERRISHD